jgi:hypothetical protein
MLFARVWPLLFALLLAFAAPAGAWGALEDSLCLETAAYAACCDGNSVEGSAPETMPCLAVCPSGAAAPAPDRSGDPLRAGSQAPVASRIASPRPNSRAPDTAPPKAILG